MSTRTKTSLSTGFLPALEDFMFQPVTNWQNFLRGWFHTDLNFGSFGSNINDEPVENYVVNEVGSYGKQLNCVLDVLTVLVAQLDRSCLTPQEQLLVYKFEDLARHADAAAVKFQDKRRQEFKRSDINELTDALLALKGSNLALYDSFVAQIQRRLSLGQEKYATILNHKPRARRWRHAKGYYYSSTFGQNRL